MRTFLLGRRFLCTSKSVAVEFRSRESILDFLQKSNELRDMMDRGEYGPAFERACDLMEKIEDADFPAGDVARDGLRALLLTHRAALFFDIGDFVASASDAKQALVVRNEAATNRRDNSLESEMERSLPP